MTTLVKNVRNTPAKPFLAKTPDIAVEADPLFKIESGIPMPKRGQPASQVTKEALLKLSNTLNQLKPGESFVFGNLSVGTVRKYLREEFTELKTRIQVVNKEKKWYRLWLMP